MIRHLTAALVGLTLGVAGAWANPEEGKVHDQTVRSIDGEDVELSTYKGKVMLVVNVASQCGYTSQYKGLEELHRAFKDKGLVVLGFPCNDFGKQEPGTEAEIKSFCESKFSVTFPMFSKIHVKGSEQAPLYKLLTEAKGQVGWNFTKFLVGKDGTILAKFDSGVAPDSKQLREAIEAALAAEAPADQ
ncbi:MAG: glutathione peroxidase [Planctomycetes bacterium]|nr:glutathione peroxidase [Planctomycetota bacterium]